MSVWVGWPPASVYCRDRVTSIDEELISRKTRYNRACSLKNNSIWE
jgi:hypothetical protein